MIERTLVREENKLEFLPKYLKNDFIRFENFVYGFMDAFCENYTGGLWDFYDLSNGGMYMSISSDEPLKVSNDMNGFCGEMTPDAASIGVNLFALNALMDSPCPDSLIELYHHLREFGMEHDEADKIYMLID